VPEAASLPTAGLSTCRVRFGSLDIRLRPGHRRYLDILPTGFRIWPALDDLGDVDLDLVARDGDQRRPPAQELADLFRIESANGATRVSTAISELALGEPTARDASLVVHVEDQDPRYVDHYVVMNLQKLLQLLGLFRLHGAAMILDGRTYVFLGGKGAGKSTLSLALGRAGAAVLADDQLVVRRSDAGVHVSGVDGGLRLTPETEAHFFARPLDEPLRDYAGTAKKEVRLADHVLAEPGVDHAPHTVLFTRVADDCRLEALPRSVGVRRILQDVLPVHRFAGPADQQDFLALVTAFVQAVDVFELALSPDLRELDSVVSLLESTRR
jgi:hypothetical protein